MLDRARVLMGSAFDEPIASARQRFEDAVRLEIHASDPPVSHVDGVLLEAVTVIEGEGWGVVGFDVEGGGADAARGEAREPGIHEHPAEPFALALGVGCDRIELPDVAVHLQPAETDHGVAVTEDEEVLGVEPGLCHAVVEVALGQLALLRMLRKSARVEGQPLGVILAGVEGGDAALVECRGRRRIEATANWGPQLFTKVRAKFGKVFPPLFSNNGRNSGVKLRRVGQVLNLSVLGLYGIDGITGRVQITQITRSSFTFRPLPDHPDYPGQINLPSIQSMEVHSWM